MLRRVVGVVVGCIMLAGLATAGYDRGVLALRGERAEAAVRSVDEAKWVDGVDVAFRTREGDAVRTTVDQVWLVRRPDARRTVAVEYDPAEPTRARIVGSHTFVAQVALFGGGLAFVVAAEVGDRRRGRHRPPGRRRRAGQA